LTLLLGLSLVGWFFYSFLPPVRVVVVKTLGRIGPSALPLVIGFGEDPSPYVQAAALEVLDEARDKAVPALRQALSHPDVRRRRFAANSLGRLGPAAAPAADALTRAAVEDPDAEVRKRAIRVLGGNTREDELKPFFDASVVPALTRALDDAEAENRMAAAEALCPFGARAAGATRALTAQLKDASADVRRQAADALEHIGPEAREAIPALTLALADSDPGVRKEAEEALESIRRVSPAHP
jgi:HEAT repeat protein